MASKIKLSRRKEYKEQLRAYIQLSKNLRAKIKRLFKKVSRKASSKYQIGLQVDDIMFSEFSDELYKVLSNHYRLVITQTANRVIKLRTKQDTEVDKIVNDYIMQNTAQKVTQISETTRALLTATIATGVADGLGAVDMGKLIRRSVAFTDYRATMISRTETHTAQNYAGAKVIKVLGFKNPVKKWVSANDDRSRHWHKSMDKKKAISADEPFIVNTPTKYGNIPYRMMYTGDSNGGASNVINCRCMTQYYDEDDIILT